MDAPLLARAPGRLNLIGEHVDYAGGAVLPLALQQGTALHGTRGGERLRLTSDACAGTVDLSLDKLAALSAAGTPPAGLPGWATLAAAVAAAVAPAAGLVAHVSGDLPVGAGLSSSASFAVALALALGWRGTALDLARLVRDAEARARGVPCGLMDPLVIAAAAPDAALLIDCAAGTTRPVPWPSHLELVVVDSGLRRELAGSAYADRRREVEAAAARLGPLPAADPAAAAELPAPLDRRARHVIGECARVAAAVEALTAGHGPTLGALLDASHASLSADFAVSLPALDQLVADLRGRPGVLGARLTGAGFGGCVVALVEAGTDVAAWPGPALRVRPAAGALAVRGHTDDGGACAPQPPA